MRKPASPTPTRLRRDCMQARASHLVSEGVAGSSQGCRRGGNQVVQPGGPPRLRSRGGRRSAPR
eukprot:13540679-Alexandrium_andersonii.AAC.1